MTTGIGGLLFNLDNSWVILLGVVLLTSLLLSTRAIYRRLRQRSVPRLLGVLGLNTLAYLVVLLLLFEPRISTTGDKAVLLVTEGADIDKTPLPFAKRVYVAPGFTTASEGQDKLAAANWLLDMKQLNSREAAIGKLEVLGYGLEREQWESLAGHPEIEFEAPVINGFHNMRWQRFLTEGDMLRIRGRYGPAGDTGVIEIRLLDPAGNTAATGRYRHGQAFGLKTRVKTRGNLEYTLQAWEDGALRREQTIALEAGAGDKFDIMIVQSAPSFETRQLKDFAAATGHRVRMSSVISKGKHIWQSANLPEDADPSFSPALLAGQDILVMDGRAFAGLPARHRQWLEEAVHGGLGLLLLADESLLETDISAGTALLEWFELAPASDSEPTTIPKPSFGGGWDWQEPATVAAMRLNSTDADVLVAGVDGRKLVVGRAAGLGHVGISLVKNSHRWLTAGQRGQWSDFWSLLLSSIARQRSDGYLLPAADADFYRLNRRTDLCALTRDTEVSIEVGDIASNGQRSTLKLAPAPDTLRSPRRCAFFWPHATGWHRVTLSGENGTLLDQKAVYVYGAGQWLDEQRERRTSATTAWAAGAGAPQPVFDENTVIEPLDNFWLWLTLVLACSMLWLERKLDFDRG